LLHRRWPFSLEFFSEERLLSHSLPLVHADGGLGDNFARLAVLQVRVDPRGQGLEQPADINLELKNTSPIPYYVTTNINPFILGDCTLSNFHIGVSPQSSVNSLITIIDCFQQVTLDEQESVRDGSIILLQPAQALNSRMHFARWRDLVGIAGTYQIRITYSGRGPDGMYSHQFLKQRIKSNVLTVTIK
jgi:hypothetical protein